jgi:hypothetical protein
MEREEREQEWAVRVHTTIRDVPGPHLLTCSSYRAACKRLEWWEANRPEVKAELLGRDVITTYGPWEVA